MVVVQAPKTARVLMGLMEMVEMVVLMEEMVLLELMVVSMV